MTRSDLENIFGTLDEIGALFAPVNGGKPLTRSAISQWKADEPIPGLRQYQLRELVPGIDRKIAAAKRRERARA